MSHHPLTAIVVGFLLTWAVGTVLTNRVSEQREAALAAVERQREISEAGAEAIASYSRDLAAHHARASMLLESLRRGSRIEEIRQRKEAYDESSAQWKANLQFTMLGLRRAMRERGYSRYEQIVDEHLVPMYQRLDSLLMSQYHAREGGAPPQGIADAEALLAAAGRCGSGVADHLYQLIHAIADPVGEPLGVSVESFRLLELQCVPRS